MQTSQLPAETPGAPAQAHAGSSVPVVITPLSPEEVVQRLDTASRRGRMPGFAPGPPPALCTTAAFGTPFDGELRVTAERTGAGGCTLRLTPRLKPLGPWLLALSLVISVYPGVLFVESFLGLFPGSSRWIWSGYWYLPLSILSAPYVQWVAVKRSRATMLVSASEMAAKIAGEVDGRVEPVSQA